MTFAKKAAKSGIWLAAFRFMSKAFSWVITILVARLLVPEDYGLMDMATMLTGYVAIFSEMGMGSAIVQKKDTSQEELSSVFWIVMVVGALLAVVSYFLAYPTAWIFDEARIIPITQVSSILFVVGAVMVVPYNLLVKEARFKEIGWIFFVTVVLSSCAMLVMAKYGFGVWTLITGTIIQRFLTALLTIGVSRWRPSIHFSLHDIKPYFTFGINVSGSTSLFYIFQKADKLIVGKMINAQALGFYSFAMQIASIPNDKIVSVIQQVSYPVLAKHQDEREKFNEYYLRISKYITLLVCPLYLGGAFFSHEIIAALLGEKWQPITFLFQMFCIAQFFTSISEINGIVHDSQGRPHWTFRFNLLKTVLMTAAVFAVITYGLNALVIPWVTLFPILCIGWTVITLRKIRIPLRTYLLTLLRPIAASVLMILSILTTKYLFWTLLLPLADPKIVFIQEIAIGTCFYLSYVYAFEKKTVAEIRSLRHIT